MRPRNARSLLPSPVSSLEVPRPAHAPLALQGLLALSQGLRVHRRGNYSYARTVRALPKALPQALPPILAFHQPPTCLRDLPPSYPVDYITYVFA